MGAVLLLADEKDAYTLTDAGTFLAFKKDLGLDAACGKWRLSPERVLRDSSKP